MARRVIGGVAAALALCGLSGDAMQDQRPRIRSGVELVSVDVQVVDGRSRPIADLEPDDFEVFIGGQRRRVASAELVQYGATGKPAPRAAAALEVPADRASPRRMYLIAVDEHSIGIGAARSAMEAARRFIARLEPGDLVGLSAYPTGTAHVDLTTDHARVIAALDQVTAMFEMPRSRYNISAAEAIDIASQHHDVLAAVQKRECGADSFCRRDVLMTAQSIAVTLEMTVTQSLGGLRSLVAGLGEIPGRKILVVVSGGLMMTDRGMGRGNELARMLELGRLAARTNTTLYALHMDMRFQNAFAERRMSNTLFRDETMFMNGLQAVAGAAGGTVFRLQTGTADPAFDRVLLETSAHYLLGVEVAEEDRDGRARSIRVSVNRRGATVRSRSSVVIPRAGG